MKKELLENLEKLDKKFNTDIDVISLKALCNVPESEEILFAISSKLNSLLEKYPEEIEIINLLPIKKIDYIELNSYLEKEYPNDYNSLRIKALISLKESKDRNLLIVESLEELYEKYPEDKIIMKALGIPMKIENKNMIFVEGGEYQTSTSYSNDVTIKVIDLYVNKYITTQEEWENIFAEELQEELNEILIGFSRSLTSVWNISDIKGKKKPVTNLARYSVYEYCNKLSIKHGYQPVYKIEYLDKSISKVPKLSIIQTDGKIVNPSIADFEKTEGYRLPTSLEWEWFAKGGKIAQEKDTFNKTKSKYILENLGWFKNNSFKNFSYEPQDVGLKEPNELGIFDYIGNVNQLVYDTEYGGWSSEEYGTPYKTIPYVYDEKEISNYISRGGFFELSLEEVSPYSLFNYSGIFGSRFDGFRVVRTAKPKRK